MLAREPWWKPEHYTRVVGRSARCPAPADQPAHADLSGEVEVGERRPAGPDEFERFAGYARQRLFDDPHLWASTLHDALLEMGGHPGRTRR